eukprot:765506-Hanusia_phi.AAC.4
MSAGLKRQKLWNEALLARSKLRKYDEDESYYALLELAMYEPTIQFCFSTLQSMCLCRDIKCRIKGRECTKDFQDFLNKHYFSFLLNAIRTMFTCGFVPVYFRKLASGDVIPECLPLGSFRWKIVPNKLKKDKKGENDGSGVNMEETSDDRDQEKEYMPKFTPKEDEQSKLLRYEIDILTGNLARKNIYIYEYAQPNFNVANSSVFYSMVSSPLCGILYDYKNLREAKARRAYADQWNCKAHLLFTTHETKVPTDEPKENYLLSHMTLPSVRMEHEMFVRQIMGKEASEQNKISMEIENEFLDDNTSLHVPSVHVIPKNFEGQVMSSLVPVEDIKQLHEHYIESVLNVFKIPQKIKSGAMERNAEISLTARIFQGEIQTLCRHLNALCESVYNIIYGGEKEEIQFLIAPNPKLSIESIDDLKALFEIGSVSPQMAKKFREVFIQADKSLLAMEDSIPNTFNNSKKPDDDDEAFNKGKYGNKNAQGFSAKEKNDVRVKKTELEYQKPAKMIPAKFKEPPKKPTK